VLPASLHIDEPSPHVDWSTGAVSLLTRAQPWQSGDQPRRAGISSFGISGTNAHVIIEEAPNAGPPPRTVLVFPGQGSQWLGMAVRLRREFPVFDARLVECERALAPFVDWSLTEVLAGERGAPGLDRVDVVQPALWAVMVSLATAWQELGVVPDAVVGHSQGEIAAATVAGILTLEDGARISALRSRALTALAGTGAMVSLPMNAEDATELISTWEGRLHVATRNGPVSTVVAGDVEAVEELMLWYEGQEVRARRIDVDYASHTPHIDQLHDTLAEVLRPV
ncbi:acyltransferase domain-containing protein, partial [Streptomyces mayteni]